MVCQCLLPSYVFAEDGIAEKNRKALDSSSVCLFMQVGARIPSATTVDMPEGSPNALEIFGTAPACLAGRIKHSDALTMLVRGKVDLESFISKVDGVEPNPDAGGLRARSAWPFLVGSRKCDELEGASPEVRHTAGLYRGSRVTGMLSHRQVTLDEEPSRGSGRT